MNNEERDEPMNPPLRQGDVTLKPSTLPDNAQPQPRDGRLILAEGEATGHAHAIHDLGAVLYTYGDRTYLVTDTAVELIHEEHGTVLAPPGSYEVLIGREWDPEGERRVAD